jgi:hypothetical protein
LILLVNFLSIYTGFGLLLGLLTPVLLLVDYATTDRQHRVAKVYLLLAVVVSLLSLGSFFIGWKFNPDLDCFSPHPRSPGWYTVYIALMLANLFAVRGITFIPRMVGGLVLLVLVATALTALRQILFAANADARKSLLRPRLVSFGMIVTACCFAWRPHTAACVEGFRNRRVISFTWKLACLVCIFTFSACRAVGYGCGHWRSIWRQR